MARSDYTGSRALVDLLVKLPWVRIRRSDTSDIPEGCTIGF